MANRLVLSRRGICCMAGAALVALGCAVVPLGCHRASDAQQLDLLAWSEYIPAKVKDGFEKETGIKVNYTTYGTNEEMLQKLGSAKYDIIQPSEYTVEAMVKKNLLQPLDYANIPNLKNIDPSMLHLPFDPDQKYSVPYMSGTVGICVNTAKVKEPVRGYADVFSEAHRNRIVVLSDSREMLTWALETLGIGINDVTPANLQKTKPILSRWMPLVKVFDSDSPKTPLLNGDVDLGIVYSGDAARCYEQDHQFKYVLPAEGSHRFVDSLCVPVGAQHKAAAEKFMNYILRPEVSKLISDEFPYTNPNTEARKLLSKEQLANPASYPPDAGKLDIFHDVGAMSSDIDKLVTDLHVQFNH